MKKILISEEQQRRIDETIAVENARLRLPSHLLDDIRNGNHPFNGSETIPSKFIENLAAKRFLEVKGFFSDDITQYSNIEISNKLNKLIAKCLRKESRLKPQLEKICLNALTEAFNIPQEGIEISCSLEDEISSTKQFHITPDTDENFEYEDYQSIENEDMDTSKRCVLNSLILGGAIKIAENVMKKCIGDIFEIDEELPHLYSQIMKINDYLIFSRKFEISDKSHKQGGYVEVTLGNDTTDTKIESHAIIFPILLIETIRGCMELWASVGLPDDMGVAKNVINKADALQNEPWYNRVGPVMWDMLYGNIENNTQDIPSFFAKYAGLPSEEFNIISREIFAGTKTGKEKSAELKRSAKYDDEYSSFEYDIQKKQSERGIIEDGYFTEEELNEAVYPENFDMEFFKSLRKFSQRIKYCENTLRRISSGSSRIVYQIDDATVLKLAKNQKGIAQNKVEGQPDWYRDSIGLFAEVYDREENYLWIEMQLADRPKYSDFYRITGFTFRTICNWLGYIGNKYCDDKDAMYFRSEEFQEKYDYSILQRLEDYVNNYNIPVGDLQRISSWGLVHDKNGEEDIVLIDYGLDDNVFNTYYSRR